MPANLPPQYFEAEKNFREAKSPLEKIAALEEMLAIMPKHKGTDHLRAELRTRIAKLNQSLDKKTATQHASMTIERVGAGQVAVIGMPNVGKSQLINSVTNASLVVAAYPFTTQSATPGMMAFENIQIQLIDTPPMAPQPVEWWRAHMLRRAGALLIVVDLIDDPLIQMETIINHLEKMRIRLVAGEVGGEEAGPLSQQKALIAGNKIDLDIDSAHYRALQDAYGAELAVTAISADDGTGLEELKRKIFQTLGIIRVYTKVPGQKPDYNDPIILEKESTLGTAAASVHKDFTAKMKYARIWGSGKHDGIMAKRDHVLQDGDVVELHM